MSNLGSPWTLTATCVSVDGFAGASELTSPIDVHFGSLITVDETRLVTNIEGVMMDPICHLPYVVPLDGVLLLSVAEYRRTRNGDIHRLYCKGQHHITGIKKITHCRRLDSALLMISPTYSMPSALVGFIRTS
jgi:hypothetical protein